MLNKAAVPIAATFSKDSRFFGKSFPIGNLVEGSGARVKADNGKWYLDWVSGLGANLLGYSDRHSDGGFYHYVSNKMLSGLAFSLPHELEYTAASKLAKMLSMHIKHWNNTDLQVRWVLSGSDACSAAVRLAKSLKGHGKTVSIGYHGWQAEFIASTPPAHGLYDIEGVIQMEWGHFPDEFDKDIDVAAIIVEIPPVMERASYIKELRQWCDDHDSLLIVDEVVTGLRYGLGGACELFNIEPDIICMGKALGNGMPIGAIVAPAEYMYMFDPEKRPHNDPVFVSSTNVGNLASLAAANFVLDYVSDGKYLNHIEKYGTMLRDGLSQAGFNVIGNAPRNLVLWENDTHKAFCIEYFAKNNIILNRPNFINMAHTQNDVEATIKIAKEATENYKLLNNTQRYWYSAQEPLSLFKGR